MQMISKILFSIFIIIAWLAIFYSVTNVAWSKFIDVWKNGIDWKITSKNLKKDFSGQISAITAKDPTAMYINGEIIGYCDELTEIKDKNDIIFHFASAHIVIGEGIELKKLKKDDIFEYGNQKYKIIYINNFSSGDAGGRHFDVMRDIRAKKI